MTPPPKQVMKENVLTMTCVCCDSDSDTQPFLTPSNGNNPTSQVTTPRNNMENIFATKRPIIQRSLTQLKCTVLGPLHGSGVLVQGILAGKTSTFLHEEIDRVTVRNNREGVMLQVHGQLVNIEKHLDAFFNGSFTFALMLLKCARCNHHI